MSCYILHIDTCTFHNMVLFYHHYMTNETNRPHSTCIIQQSEVIAVDLEMNTSISRTADKG